MSPILDVAHDDLSSLFRATEYVQLQNRVRVLTNLRVSVTSVCKIVLMESSHHVLVLEVQMDVPSKVTGRQ